MMMDFLLTSVLFCVTWFLLPLLATSYLVLKLSHGIWVFCISILHPDVEFLRTTTIRSLLDTHRNQGIISILLSIKGQAQPEAVRRHLQEVVKRRNKVGNLSFPRLRHCLVTRCGTYAWQRGTFDLDQNITVAPQSYKGRAVTEFNIQDYVSEIVSKYLPTGIPPWQVIIIPSNEDQHYILIKLHHILLNEGLNIGELLPLIPPTRQLPGLYHSRSPLVGVISKPVAIPKLKERLTQEMANRWNEIISNYDPLECTDLLKNSPGYFQFLAIIFITIISAIRECRKGFRVIKNDLFSQTKFILVTLKREARKRKVNPETFLKSIFVTLDPRNILALTLKCWKFFLTLPFTFPLFIYNEVMSLYFCVTLKYCAYPQTIVGTLYDYVPLLYNALKESFYYFSMLFNGPRVIVEDILLQKESFQTITLCGRKSVAWSDPVKMDQIKLVAKTTGVSELEIMLAAISACVSKYFIQTKHLIPDDLPVTIRNINSNYIFATGQNIKPEDSVSGILCLNLPIPDPEKEVSILENLVDIKNNFRNCLNKQGLSHLLSFLQTKFGVLTRFLPSSMLGVYLRYLSRTYAVQITEITSRHPNVTQKTLWGQEVNSAIYWRPPQANSSISLCLNEYADHVKLGVMCDSQLVPHHPILARGFPEFIHELSRSAGLQKSSFT